MESSQDLLKPFFSPGRAKSWSSEKVYFRGDDYFREILQSIRTARRYIDIETYIFERGRLGDQMVAALIRAHRRGGRVRLFVDGVGSPDFLSHYGPRLEKADVPFRVYRSWPTFFSSIFHRFGLLRPVRSLHYAFSIWNSGKHRDHRKQYIVDGKKSGSEASTFRTGTWRGSRPSRPGGTRESA